MKSLKLICLLGIIGGFSNAATITVSKGFGAQGFTVLVDGVASGYNWSVGNYNTITSTWTQFGADQVGASGAKVGAAVTATSPTSLNGSIVDVFVGTGNTIANSTGWMIFTTNAATLFPADVTVATNVTLTAALTNAVNVVAAGNVANGFSPIGASGGNLNLVTVPETSTALLGALGALTLLRRRR